METEHPSTAENYDESDWSKSREYIRREMSRMARAIDELKEEVRRMRESIERREERVSDIIQSHTMRNDAAQKLLLADRAQQNIEMEKIRGEVRNRAGFVGGLCGAIPVTLMVVYELLKKI